MNRRSVKSRARRSLSHSQSLISLAITVLVFSSSVVAVHFFAHRFVPPLLLDSGVFRFLPALFAVVAFAMTVGWQRSIRHLDRKLIFAAMSSALVIGIYLTTFPFLTVRSPVDDGHVYQVGFSTADWSLRPEAAGYLQKNPMMRSIDDLMLDAGAFRSGGPATVWKPWTIWAAGMILALLFTYAYVAISVTIGLLFHHHRFKPNWMDALKLGSACT